MQVPIKCICAVEVYTCISLMTSNTSTLYLFSISILHIYSPYLFSISILHTYSPRDYSIPIVLAQYISTYIGRQRIHPAGVVLFYLLLVQQTIGYQILPRCEQRVKYRVLTREQIFFFHTAILKYGYTLNANTGNRQSVVGHSQGRLILLRCCRPYTQVMINLSLFLHLLTSYFCGSQVLNLQFLRPRDFDSD